MSRREKRAGEPIKAVAYLCTSSAANVGGDKDSDRRQREAIEAFARRAGFEIVGNYYDAAVSGADPITSRPGFAAMLGNGVRTIIVETAKRFARDLMVQEVGHAHLRDQGNELVAADSPQSFVDNTPTARLVRQVLGAIAEFDKAMIVAKLKGARDRKSAEAGRRIEGRKGFSITHPEAVALAKRLRRASPKTGERRSLRDISALLAEAAVVLDHVANSRAKAERRGVNHDLAYRVELALDAGQPLDLDTHPLATRLDRRELEVAHPV